MANKFVARIVLEGEKEYREAVAGCNRENAKLRSELTLVKEKYAGNANSLQALKAKQDVLNKSLVADGNKVQETNRAYNNSVNIHSKLKSSVEKLNKEYQEEKEKLEKLKSSGTASRTEIEKQQKKVEQLSSALDKGNFNIATAAKRMDDWKIKLNTAQAQEQKMTRAVQENKKYLDEASRSVDKHAYSIDGLGKKSKEAEAKSSEAIDTLSYAMASAGVQEKSRGGSRGVV